MFKFCLFKIQIVNKLHVNYTADQEAITDKKQILRVYHVSTNLHETYYGFKWHSMPTQYQHNTLYQIEHLVYSQQKSPHLYVTGRPHIFRDLIILTFEMSN